MWIADLTISNDSSTNIVVFFNVVSLRILASKFVVVVLFVSVCVYKLFFSFSKKGNQEFKSHQHYRNTNKCAFYSHKNVNRKRNAASGYGKTDEISKRFLFLVNYSIWAHCTRQITFSWDACVCVCVCFVWCAVRATTTLNILEIYQFYYKFSVVLSLCCRSSVVCKHVPMFMWLKNVLVVRLLSC